MKSHCCLCVCMLIPLNNFMVPEPIFMKYGVYIMSPETISMVYIVNPSHQ
jgi:hypothetical protein